jgi:hypothetical protein
VDSVFRLFRATPTTLDSAVLVAVFGTSAQRKSLKPTLPDALQQQIILVLLALRFSFETGASAEMLFTDPLLNLQGPELSWSKFPLLMRWASARLN